MRRVNILILAALVATPIAIAAHAQHGDRPQAGGLVRHIADHLADARHEPGPQPAPTTADLQGSDAWRRDPHIRAFYEVVKAAFANGPDKVDNEALEAKSFVIFRDFAVSKGMDPAAMQDHLKLIPRQMIKIAREDPTVLVSFDAFADAVFGPR